MKKSKLIETFSIAMKFSIAMIFSFAVFFQNGCAGNSKDQIQEKNPPVLDGLQRLPDSRTLLMDLEIFQDQSDVHLRQGLLESGISAFQKFDTSSNFWRANSKLALMTKEVNERISLAAAILEKGQLHEFQLLAEDQWVSSFNISARRGRKYLANINATKVGNELFQWQIELIEDENNFENKDVPIKVMEGTSDSSKSGIWKIFDIEHQLGESYDFEIKYSVGDGSSRSLSVSFHEAKPSYAILSAGSFVKYTESKVAVSLEIDDVSQPLTERIAWKKDDHSGRYFDSTGYEMCWDTEDKNFIDIACGE